MFTYSSLLVTMCRNIITYLRDTVANNYFAFDSMVEIHKYIAGWAFLFTCTKKSTIFLDNFTNFPYIFQ